MHDQLGNSTTIRTNFASVAAEFLFLSRMSGMSIALKSLSLTFRGHCDLTPAPGPCIRGRSWLSSFFGYSLSGKPMAKTSVWTTRSSSPRQYSRVAQPGMAHLRKEFGVIHDSARDVHFIVLMFIFRRRLLRRRRGTADSRSQYPEGRGRFARSPCRHLLEPPAQHRRFSDSLRRPEHRVSDQWAIVRRFLTIFIS